MPFARQINFDSPVNGDEQYTGSLYAGRLEFTPWGRPVPYSQGDLVGKAGLTSGANAYHRTNDGSPQTATPGTDWDTVTGYGLDAAWRGGRFSTDAGYNWISGTSRDPSTTTGIIQNCEGRLQA